jgi:hypothetical protein
MQQQEYFDMQIQRILEELRAWAESDRPSDHIVVAVNQARGAMLNRIFNSEAGTKDVNGAGLGKYSNAYAKVRERKGRQTAVKDLEFTGTLRRDIKTIKNGNHIAVVIQSVEERKIAGYLEKMHQNRDIFDFSKDEIKEADAVALALFREDINQILNGTGA